MSGIAAIVHLDNSPVDNTVPAAAAAAMARRGPDAQRTHTSGSIGLAHAALITTPEAVNEHQPVCLNHCRITADVRLDNRDSLWPHFEHNQLPLKKEAGDATYILAAYLLWGEACVDYLLGDFAFAIWDEARHKLFAARDHFGTKPLNYYFHPHRLFACASEICALLAIPQVPEQINEARIADYIVSQLEGRDKTSTLYQDIFRLPPAHTLSVENSQLKIRQYWELEPPQPIQLASDAEYAEAFLHHFTEAVRCRLRSPSPDKVGIMLSGGVDSTSIAGVARRLLAESHGVPLKTFSAISDREPQDDETRCIQAMIEDDRIRAVTIGPSQMQGFLPELEYILRHNTNLFSNWMEVPQLVYVAAKKSGAKIVLDGVGGDHLTSVGAWYIGKLLHARRWRMAYREAVGYSNFYGTDIYPPGRLLFNGLRYAFVPDFLRQLRHKLRTATDYYYQKQLRETVINSDFAAAQKLPLQLALLDQSLAIDPQALTPMRQAHWLNHAYIPVALERYDHVATTQSIESRRPYLDKRLVKFCLALPIDQKMRNGWPKFIVRSAMNGLTPDIVRLRTGKAHLGWDFTTKRHQLEYIRIESTLHNNFSRLAQYIDISKLQVEFSRFEQTGTLNSEAIWIAFTMALWLTP